jgi:two-component system chemotaxis response regulator CheB
MGGYIISQDEASCVVYGMPRAVVEAGIADEILPLDSIADSIMRNAK